MITDAQRVMLRRGRETKEGDKVPDTGHVKLACKWLLLGTRALLPSSQEESAFIVSSRQEKRIIAAADDS